MKKVFCFICLCICVLILVSGCDKNATVEGNLSENNKEVWFTNDTHVLFKSIDLTLDDDEEHVLLSGNVAVNDTAKFSVPDSVSSVTVTLNSKDAYSVKKALELKFADDNILKYKIVIEKNEITLKVQDKQE